MSNQPKVSIIVPVYNVKKYIKKCFVNLFEQTLDNIEIIVINDCTPDNSIEIINELIKIYPQRENQIKFISHNKNEGISKSRQDGLDIATGKYIIHCDPDDYPEKNMYENLYNIAEKENSDMVICGIYSHNELTGNVKYNPQRPDYNNYIVIRSQMTRLTKNIMGVALWNKLIKSDIAKKYKIESGLCRFEDGLYLLDILSSKIKISYISTGFYHYNIRKDSLTSKVTKQVLESDIKLFNYLNKRKSGDTNLNNCIDSQIGYILQLRLFKYPKPEIFQALNRIKQFNNYKYYSKKTFYIKHFFVKGALKFNYNFFRRLNCIFDTLLYLPIKFYKKLKQ